VVLEGDRRHAHAARVDAGVDPLVAALRAHAELVEVDVVPARVDVGVHVLDLHLERDLLTVDHRGEVEGEADDVGAADDARALTGDELGGQLAAVEAEAIEAEAVEAEAVEADAVQREAVQ